MWEQIFEASAIGADNECAMVDSTIGWAARPAQRQKVGQKCKPLDAAEGYEYEKSCNGRCTETSHRISSRVRAGS